MFRYVKERINCVVLLVAYSLVTVGELEPLHGHDKNAQTAAKQKEICQVTRSHIVNRGHKASLVDLFRDFLGETIISRYVRRTQRFCLRILSESFRDLHD
jgi:hypothetical protein